jgi:hypothetical protein
MRILPVMAVLLMTAVPDLGAVTYYPSHVARIKGNPAAHRTFQPSAKKSRVRQPKLAINKGPAERRPFHKKDVRQPR